jgi:DNA-directed RNA polymerase specialized sigma24 family protein
VYPRLHTVADPAALKPWIAQLARRVALDRLRLDARELPSDASTFELAAERNLTEIELAMVVREALDCLDEPFREVIRRFSSRTRATGRSARRWDCRLAPWRRASRAVW